MEQILYIKHIFVINPRSVHMRSEGYSTWSVYVSVCLLSHISSMEHMFVLKRLSHTQQATKVEKFVGICLK